MVAREVLRYKRGRHGKPFHFLDFALDQGYAITNEEDFSKEDEDLSREVQALDAPDILAVKGLGQFDRFKVASALRLMIENWRTSDFHVSDARPSQEDGFAEHLSTRGDNLPLVANYLFEHHPHAFTCILEAMNARGAVRRGPAKLQHAPENRVHTATRALHHADTLHGICQRPVAGAGFGHQKVL